MANTSADEANLPQRVTSSAQWYDQQVPIRGCKLSLADLKAAYREFDKLNKEYGRREIASVEKQQGETEEQLTQRKQALFDAAFRVTVSIVGFDGQTTYGDSVEVFDSDDLPSPIKSIFFTNGTAFKPFANGNRPANGFSVWLHFDKPPLFDPDELLSAPTHNDSMIEIRADDVPFFRASQNIARSRLQKPWGLNWALHGKFAYDAGLWFIAMPYSLYWISLWADRLVPTNSESALFRVAFFIYGIGLSLLVYRALFSYLKWAFPLNVLVENKDRALLHRGVIAALSLGLFGSFLTIFFPRFFGF